MKWYEKIRKKRLEKGMSQDELARKAGYSGRSAVSNIEKGRRNISFDAFNSLAKALNCDALSLMDDDSTSIVAEPTFEYTATDELFERLKAYYTELSYKDRETLVKYAEFLTKEK